MDENIRKNWQKIIKNYNRPNPAKSWWQIANSLIPFLAIWYFMYIKLDVYPYWVILLLALVESGFMVRMFIFFHDCGHGSFFKSKKLNTIVGIFLGLFTFTPFHKWTYEHAVHHKTVGNLDKRGVGDVLTLTVDEYKKRTPIQKLEYRIMRNPLFLFFLGGFLNFLILNKIPKKSTPKKIKWQTFWNVLLILAVITGVCFLTSLRAFLLIQIPILYISSIFGVYLFYVQHQYRDVLWLHQDEWDYLRVSLEGCSYLKLPKILQWFSGNIGFHHIHHLSSKIPNYNLEKCLKENPEFQIKPMTIASSIKNMKYHLWDEQKHKLVSFKEALQ